MNKSNQSVSVIFPEWYDALAEFEHTHKGYLNGVIVKVANGKQYSFNFIDPARLQQSLDDNVSEGLNYFSERNLIVLLSVTKDNILTAINAMCKEGIWEETFLADR